jgi:hypothetical protein
LPLDDRATRLPFAAFIAALLLVLGRESFAQSLLVRTVADYPGTTANAQLGGSVAALGDVNGDGYPDFAIGEPFWGPTTADSTGRVEIFFGGRRKFDVPDLVLVGQSAGGQFGYTIADLGDINADGYEDFAISAPSFVYPNPVLQGSGRIFLFLGSVTPTGQPSFVFNAPVIERTNAVRGYGYSVTAVGDANADGYPDWVASLDATTSFPLSGGGLLYLGGSPPATTTQHFLVNSGSGRPYVFGCGDMDGDQLGDLIISYPAPRSGPSGMGYYTRLNSASIIGTSLTVGQGGGPGFGRSFLPLGDFDHDGLPDLLVGAPRTAGGSAVYYYTPGGGHQFVVTTLVTPEAVADSFGIALAGGALEGPGTRDVVVGAPGDDVAGVGSGTAYFFRLGSNLQMSDFGFMRGSPGDYLGMALASPGDVDGNGVADLLVGSPMRNGAAQRCGRAQLVSLSAHTLIEPSGVEEWTAGGTARVRWLGAAPVRIGLSLDNGVTWQTVLDGAGGAAENSAMISLPDTVSARAQVRVTTVGALVNALNTDVCSFSHSIIRPKAAIASASQSHAFSSPSDPSGRLGAAICAGRDLNGDGRPDAVIGAPYSDLPEPNAGSVQVRWGGGAEPTLLSGEHGADLFGSSISISADADGDGVADLVIGAPGSSAGAANAGAAYLYSLGPSRSPVLRVTGTQAGEALGTSVALMRGFDNGPGGEFVASAPFYRPAGQPTSGGRVMMWRGNAPSGAPPVITLGAPLGALEFGRALATLDLNADGLADLAVSALGPTGNPGMVFIYFGGAGTHAKPDLVLRGTLEADEFGAALADAGDLNGDGVHDLAVGAPGANGERGRVQIYLGGMRPGPMAARTVEGQVPGERFGAAMAGAGDMNGDGRDDLVVGGPGRDGACRLFLGGATLVPDASWTDGQPGSQFGAALAGAGDMNGDGIPEILAGAPLESGPRTDGVGSVQALSTPRYVLESPSDGDAWFSGSTTTLRWRGAEPARLELSVDGGAHWVVLAANAGGLGDNALDFTIPEGQADSALIRLTPVLPSVPGGLTVSRKVKVRATGTLQFFHYALAGDGVHLSWEAEPGVGPQGWSAYRVYRSAPGGAFERVSGSADTASTLVVGEHRRGLTYELRAVNGLNEEQVLGRVTVPDLAAPLRIWPVPSDDWRPVELAIAPPVGANGRTPEDFTVWIYDLRGRRVACLAGGSMATIVGELRLTWNRMVDGGAVAEPGVFFVRAEAASAGWRAEQRLVILR